MRELIASGNARPEEIAIAAASPADFDDHMMALCADANIPIHFVHGVKAVTNRDGQTAAALAETLIKGVSQERVRRLFALLHDASKAIVGLPRDGPTIALPSRPARQVERQKKTKMTIGRSESAQPSIRYGPHAFPCTKSCIA